MNITNLSHIALMSRDVAKIVSFYQDFAEMELIHRRVDDGINVAWLKMPDTNGLIIVVIENKNIELNTFQRVNHFGFDAKSKEIVDSISRKAQMLNCLIYPAFDGGEILGYMCLIADPDGNQLEFAYGQMRIKNYL